MRKARRLPSVTAARNQSRNAKRLGRRVGKKLLNRPGETAPKCVLKIWRFFGAWSLEFEVFLIWHLTCCFFTDSEAKTVSMNERIRILHLEDERDFSELVQSLLQKDGIDAEIVFAPNRSEFEAALARKQFDLVLADYLLPD